MTTVSDQAQSEVNRPEKPFQDHQALPHNVPTLSRLTRPPEGENRPSVMGQRTVAQGWIVTV